MSKKFVAVELYNSYKKQNGNAKNADIKRFIKLLEAGLSHPTIRNSFYIVAGGVAISYILKELPEVIKALKDNEIEVVEIKNKKEGEVIYETI
jgi:hypothetical protein